MNHARRELSIMIPQVALSIFAITLAWGIVTPSATHAQSHCTAMVNSQCECSGCSSFRRQRNQLICPPSMPTEVPPGSEQFIPNPDAGSVTGEPPIELPGQEPIEEPSFDAPDFSDVVADPPSPEMGPSQTVPPNQVPNDQSVLDPIPMAGQQAVSAAAPSASLFAASSGTANAGAGIPAMFGDFCGLGARPLSPTGFGPPRGTTTPVAGGDCRHKWAEFTAPCPADRVFFTYHHYNNGLTDINTQNGDADLFTFGFEKSLWDNLASLETRISFLGAGIESTQVIGGDTFGAELGNLATTFKVLLINERNYAVSVGTTTVWPTGSDGDYGGLFTVRNESIHVMPFMAWLYKPNSNWFHQGNVQLDFDFTGDSIISGGSQIDVIQDQTFLYLDYSIGRWLYQNDNRFVRRAAGLFELHYSTSLDNADTGENGLFAGGSFNILNATAGMHFQLGNATTFRIGAGAPLRTGDRAFDSEITMQLAKYF